MYTNTLAHHGILGQKWGVRRYQNKDGTLTEAGKKRYGYDTDGQPNQLSGKAQKELQKSQKKWDKNLSKNWWKAYNEASARANSELIPKLNNKYKNLFEIENWPETKRGKQYYAEFENEFNALYEESVERMFGKRPGGY